MSGEPIWDRLRHDVPPRLQARADALAAALDYVMSRNDWESAAGEVAASVNFTPEKLHWMARGLARLAPNRNRIGRILYQAKCSLWCEDHGKVWNGAIDAVGREGLGKTYHVDLWTGGGV